MNRFAFILHPLTVEWIYRKFHFLRPLPDRWVERAFCWVRPFTLSHITGIRSLKGTEAEGWFIGLPLTARMLMEKPWPFVLSRLIQAGRVAEELGAQIIGLGAFTKIVGDRGVSLNASLSIPVTTGNSYTAATAVEGLLAAAGRMGVELRSATCCVIGATGSIGAVCAEMLGPQVARVVLVARNRERLEFLREKLRRTGVKEVVVSSSPREAVREADLVVAVSSATDVLVEPEDLKPGSVVCDVARPRNISPRVYARRDDVLVIDGGVIEVPGEVDFGFNFGFPPKMAEACICETIILALEGKFVPFTLGPDISLGQVEEIARLGREHGFRLAGFRRGERPLGEEEIERIRENARRVRQTGT